MQIESNVVSASSLATDAMLQAPGAGASPVQAAREFEGLLTSMLLKQMRQTVSGEGLFPGDASDTYGGMFDMYLGDFIARSGGLGLADQIESTLRSQMGRGRGCQRLRRGRGRGERCGPRGRRHGRISAESA